MSIHKQLIAAIFLLLSVSVVMAENMAKKAVFDMHMHYKWSQKDVTTPEDTVRMMDEQNISHAVLIGKPPELALEIKEQAPDRITAIYSPYQQAMDWLRWQYDDDVLNRANEALKSGKYKGIGELHIIGGFARKRKKSNVLDGLMKLAKQYEVPVLLHTEFSHPKYMLTICEKHPDTAIIWAHTGAILEPKDVDTVMSRCSNIIGGMAARDPWRYVNNPHTDTDGKLLPGWKALFLKYPNRFMVGSDTVWPVDQTDRWDEPDTGWQQLGKFWDFHRSWLKQLPDEVSEKIGRTNALKIFGYSN